MHIDRYIRSDALFFDPISVGIFRVKLVKVYSNAAYLFLYNSLFRWKLLKILQHWEEEFNLTAFFAWMREVGANQIYDCLLSAYHIIFNTPFEDFTSSESPHSNYFHSWIFGANFNVNLICFYSTNAYIYSKLWRFHRIFKFLQIPIKVFLICGMERSDWIYNST